MKWLELTIETKSCEVAELTTALEMLGVSGLLIEDEADFLQFLEENKQYWDYVDEGFASQMAGKSRVRFYLEDTDNGRAELAALRAQLTRPLHVAVIEEEDWANNWKQYYKPLAIGNRFLVLPQWETAELNGRIPLILDPGLIFGTGSHPTTKRCLMAIEEVIKPGQCVLDLGAGSGILSIAALKMGAAHVTACDIDPKAPDIAYANAALNGIKREQFLMLHGDALAEGAFRDSLGQAPYDVILANIVADVIMALGTFITPWLKPGGFFITAGIIDGRQDEVEAALTVAGFTIVSHAFDEGWHSYVCRR